MTPAEALDAAADLLERDGWIQGNWERDGKYCAVGALYAIEHQRDDFNALYDAEEILSSHLRCAVAVWNDNPERTADEVIERLHKVAAEARWSE